MLCDGCLLGEVAFYRLSKGNLWAWLVEHGVLPGSMDCPRCHAPCHFRIEDDSFRCWRPRKVRKGSRMVKVQCNFKRSARNGTCFGNSRLTVIEISDFCAMWVSTCYPKTERLISHFGFSTGTVVEWSSFCRDVCIEWAINNSQQLGGPGVVVEIDEAKFERKKSGRVHGNWVFGGIQRGSRKCFLEPVEFRSREVLFRIIKEKILPGTTIIGDCFSSYDTLDSEDFQHLRVNHSLNFVDLKGRSVHTQNVERMWRDVRGAIPRYGRKTEHFAGYLAEYMFRRAYRPKEMLHHFFVEAGKLYPPGGIEM